MISVTAPIEFAIERTKKLLFRPFSAEKWFVLGFCAFLANLTGGGSYRGGNFFRQGRSETQAFRQLGDWVSSHLMLVIGIGLLFLLLILALVALFQWLGSRGQFMFLDGVVQDRARVTEPWRRFRELGNNLFLFRFLLGLAGVGSILIIGFMAWLIARPDIAARHFGGLALSAMLVGGGLVLLTALALAIVELLLADFIVPIMYRLNVKTVEAISVFRQTVLPGHVGPFALFYLMKLALGIAAAVIIIAGTCLTCCIAGLPYLSSVFFLPVFVFFRCYSLFFLEQFGEDWHLMSSADAPEIQRDQNVPTL